MLFGLNTVSGLTLIDVPVRFLLPLQTENTHKSGYYRLGGVRQKQDLSAAFRLPFVTAPFPSVPGSETTAENKGEEMEKDCMERGSDGECIADDSRERRGTLKKNQKRVNKSIQSPKFETIPPTHCKVSGVAIFYLNVQQDVKQLTDLSVPSANMCLEDGWCPAVKCRGGKKK